MGDEFEGLRVEGGVIASLPEKERYCIVLEKPQYKDLPDFNDVSKTQRKLVAVVTLANGSKAEYVMNKKSGSFVAQKVGTDFNKWVGCKLIWGSIVKQQIGKELKDVLYITDVILPQK